MKRSSSAWGVTGLGTLASLLGGMLLRRRRRGGLLGSGILGFGLAHVVLGLLDRARIKA